MTKLRKVMMTTKRRAQRPMARGIRYAAQWAQEWRKKKREMKKMIRANKGKAVQGYHDQDNTESPN